MRGSQATQGLTASDMRRLTGRPDHHYL